MDLYTGSVVTIDVINPNVRLSLCGNYIISLQSENSVIGSLIKIDIYSKSTSEHISNHQINSNIIPDGGGHFSRFFITEDLSTLFFTGIYLDVEGNSQQSLFIYNLVD